MAPNFASAANASDVDPYLWLADAIAYIDHITVLSRGQPSFGIAVEMNAANRQPARVPGLVMQPGHAGSRFRTATATVSACKALLADPKVRRVQFAAPLLPQRPPQPWHAAPCAVPPPRTAAARKLPPPTSSAAAGGLLLASIDTGCPFAHADLQRPAGGTRVVRLWDQGSGATWDGLGARPAGFDYGRELTTHDLDLLIARAGSDRAACYQRAGYGPVLGRASHGAHALGMLAAARRWNGRPALRQQPAVSMAPHAVSAAADVAFVQLPHELMRCVSVAALERHALDALRYLVAQATAMGHTRLLVSFGFESWVGPHDGSTWFAQAVDDLILQSQSVGLQVFTIAGNAKNRQAHVAASPGATRLDTTLCLPPDNEVVTWIEVWAPARLAGWTLQLTPPNGPPLPPLQWGRAAAWPDAQQPVACVVMRNSAVHSPDGCMSLLRLAPTRVSGGPQAAAPHGLWRLSIQAGGQALKGVHAYIGRNEATLGSSRRGRQATFVGRNRLEQTTDMAGTLNGHASSGAVVSGAAYPSHFPWRLNRLNELTPMSKSTPYSGAGPSRNAARAGPEDSLAVEDGLYANGTLGMGNRSGTVVRLSGTSVAAPLRARLDADGLVPPLPRTAEHAADIGRQLLEPLP